MESMSRSTLLFAGFVAVAIVALLFSPFIYGAVKQNQTNDGGTMRQSRSSLVEVVRVVDGNTLAIASSARYPASNEAGTEHLIRLRGIVAPTASRSCGADDARDHLAEIVEGSRVRLTYRADEGHADAFGTTTAYVSVPGETNDLGKRLIADGYASAGYGESETRPERWGDYTRAEQRAIERDAGLRALCSSF